MPACGKREKLRRRTQRWVPRFEAKKARWEEEKKPRKKNEREKKSERGRDGVQGRTAGTVVLVFSSAVSREVSRGPLSFFLEFSTVSPLEMWVSKKVRSEESELFSFLNSERVAKIRDERVGTWIQGFSKKKKTPKVLPQCAPRACLPRARRAARVPTFARCWSRKWRPVFFQPVLSV